MKSKLVILFLAGYFFCINAYAQCNTSGIFSVGPTGTYPTLTAASNALRADGLLGPVTLELQSTYSSAGETFPIDFSGINCLSSTNILTIRPAAGATSLSITTTNQYTIDLHNTRFLVIDGRPGGTGTSTELTIINTHNQGAAIRFINGASRNVLTYLNVQGSASTGIIQAVNTFDTTGVINFSASTTGSGCDSNMISYCNISKAGTITPGTLIHAEGASGKVNDRNTITHCNLSDFYQQDRNSFGILIKEHNLQWTISNNSIYQTSSRTYTVTTFTPDVFGIKILSSFYAGFTISQNYIGGSAPLTAGNVSSMAGNFMYHGISISGIFLSTLPSDVSGNTVANISISVSNNLAQHVGISLTTGFYGTCTNNTIGSMSANNSITFNCIGNSGAFIPLSATTGSSATLPSTLYLNKIGGITVSGLNSSFWGINTGAISNIIVDSNQIGSATMANSIVNNASGAIYGIRIVNYSSSGNLKVKSNTIQNLRSGSGAIGASVTGIFSEGSASGRYEITKNRINNLSANTTNNSSTASAVSGMAINVGGTPAITINNNVIDQLTTTSSSNNYINGIYYKGPVAGADSINANIITSFTSASTGNLKFRGIHIEDGISSIYNNIIRLGLDANGNSITIGYSFTGISEKAGQNQVIHNTVYIGGNNVIASTGNSYCFSSAVTSGTRVVANNIFYNARSTTSGAGKNYCIDIAGNTGLYEDYNIFYANGTRGHLGRFNNTDYDAIPAWSAATSTDANSNFIDPQFAGITGPVSSMNYHLAAINPAEGSGTNTNTVLNDIDGEIRSGLTPVDIGADAGLYSNTPVVDVSAPVITYTALVNATNTNNVILTANITDAGTGVDITGSNAPRIWYRRNTPVQSAWVSTAAVLTSGTINAGTYSLTIDYTLIPGGVQWGDNIQYYVVAQDAAVPFNIASVPVAQHTSVNVQVAAPATPDAYTIVDNVAPVISYAAITNQGNTNNVTLTATIADAAAGVDITTNAPRVWYRRNSPNQSAWFNTTGSLTSGTINSGTYEFNIDYSLIPGGVQFGNNIQYYVVAQDKAVPFNIASVPVAQHTSVSIQISAPPTPNAYSIIPQISGDILVGTGQAYTSLTNPGGIFAAINAYSITGDLTIKVTSDLIETGANQLNNAGLQGHQLKIVPATNGIKRIYNNVNISDPLLHFNNTTAPIVIDGSFNGAGRNLLFSYASTLTTNTFVQNCLFITGDNIIIKNSVFESTCNYPLCGTIYLLGPNKNIVIDNNILKDVTTHPVATGLPQIALYINGGKNISVTNNEIYNASRCLLDFGSGVDTCYVTGNHFYNTVPFTGDKMLKVYGGSEFYIKDNHFGGTAPNCGGAPFSAAGNLAAMSIINNTGWPVEMKMSIQNNTIKNIRIAATNTQSIPTITFHGIMFDNIDTINIGNETGNIIGDINDPASIELDIQSNSQLEVAGIRYQGSKQVNISNNSIGGFTVNADLTYAFKGGGILSPTESTVAGSVPTNVITENNTIRNINCTITSPVSWGWLYGINTGNLEAHGNVTIRSNNISGIRGSFTNPGSFVAGIAVTQKDPGNNTIVERNRIYGLVQKTPYGLLAGINIGSNAIDTRLYNNQVSVTNEGFTNPLNCYGIYSDGDNNLWSGQQQSFLYNSIYVGGQSSVTDTSVAFNFSARSAAASSGTHVNTFRNNLLYNERTSPAGKHLALSVNIDPARSSDWSAAASDYNLLVVGDTLSTARWQNGNPIRLSEFKQFYGGDQETYFTLTSKVPATDLFVNMNTANLDINSLNDVCWYVNGKGSAIDSLGVDFGNDPRSTATTNGSTDIGADEFNTTTVPPTVDVYGRHMPGSSDTLVWAGRAIGLINWGNTGLLPTFGPIRWFTGTWPNDTTNNGTINGARFMNHYIQVATTGGNDYRYDFTMNYIPSLLGRITNESTMILNKREINVNGSWRKIIPTIADPANHTLKVTGLASFSEFTGTDGNAALSNSQLEDPINPTTNNDELDVIYIKQNPANGVLTIRSNLSASKNIALDIIDGAGKTVARYNTVASGLFNYSMNIGQYANGVYFLRSQVGGNKQVTRFLVMNK